MPTQKPRVNVAFDDETFALLQRLSDLGGGSMAGIVRELVQTARPMLERMVAATEAFQAADAEARAKTIAALEAMEPRVQAALTDAQTEVHAAFDQAAGLE